LRVRFLQLREDKGVDRIFDFRIRRRDGDRRHLRRFGAGEIVAAFPVGKLFGVGAALRGEFIDARPLLVGVMIPALVGEIDPLAVVRQEVERRAVRGNAEARLAEFGTQTFAPHEGFEDEDVRLAIALGP
jgi:hypothetical protein